MVIVLELRVRARYRIRYVSKAGLFRHFCFDQIILASFFSNNTVEMGKRFKYREEESTTMTSHRLS